jgi:hypothetical protein
LARIIALRIRKGKILGQEFELLDELQAKTEVAEATSSKIASATGTASGTGSATAEGAGAIGEESVLDAIEEVLQEASRSPRLGLILLDAKIERALREQPRLAAYRPPGEPPVFLPELRREVFEALTSFKQVRNRIVHGGDAGDDEVARAIDSGTRLLRLLLSRPRPPAEPDDG